jgi:hypothetical protein
MIVDKPDAMVLCVGDSYFEFSLQDIAEMMWELSIPESDCGNFSGMPGWAGSLNQHCWVGTTIQWDSDK